MLLLSIEQKEREIVYADLVDIDRSLQSKTKTLSSIKLKGFTNYHMIKLVHEDKKNKKNKTAIFVTQTRHSLLDINREFRAGSLIDSVTVLKLVLDENDKLK